MPSATSRELGGVTEPASGLSRSPGCDYISHMTTTSISQLKARLSFFIDLVRHGDEVLVTDRGRPVARIAPVQGEDEELGRREMLIRTGRLKAPSKPVSARFWKRMRPVDAEGRSLSVLLEERSDGR